METKSTGNNVPPKKVYGAVVFRNISKPIDPLPLILHGEPKRLLSFGKGQTCDIIINKFQPTEKVSELHALLLVDGEDIVLENCADSSFGTLYLNSHQIQEKERVKVQFGDIIRLAQKEFEINHPSAAPKRKIVRSSSGNLSGESNLKTPFRDSSSENVNSSSASESAEPSQNSSLSRRRKKLQQAKEDIKLEPKNEEKSDQDATSEQENLRSEENKKRKANSISLPKIRSWEELSNDEKIELIVKVFKQNSGQHTSKSISQLLTEQFSQVFETGSVKPNLIDSILSKSQKFSNISKENETAVYSLQESLGSSLSEGEQELINETQEIDISEPRSRKKSKKKNKESDSDEDVEEELNDEDLAEWTCAHCKVARVGASMVACDSCSSWYHFECAKVPETDNVEKQQFVCTTCLRKKRRNARDTQSDLSKSIELKKEVTELDESAVEGPFPYAKAAFKVLRQSEKPLTSRDILTEALRMNLYLPDNSEKKQMDKMHQVLISNPNLFLRHEQSGKKTVYSLN